MDWFVQNPRDATWIDCRLGKFCDWQREGERFPRGVLYPADPVAQKHGAGVAEETSSPKEAYAGIEFPKVPYKQGWLAD